MCIDDRFSKPVVLYRGKNTVHKYITAIFKGYSYCRKVIKKHFNKNLVMTVDDEEYLTSSTECWICGLMGKTDVIYQMDLKSTWLLWLIEI